MLGSDRGRYAPIRAPRLTCGTRVPRPPSEEDLQLWSVLSTLSNVPNAAHAVETFGPQPVTLGLAALLAAVNLQPESYWDSDVVLNADAVVRHRQLYRLPSGQMVHWNYAHLACNVAALVASGLPLERRLGTVGMAGSMLAAGALSGGFYILASRLMSRGTGVQQSVLGFSGVGYALQTYLDQLRPAEQLGGFGKYTCWALLAVNTFLAPTASLAMHASGIVAGLTIDYVAPLVRRLWSWLVRTFAGGPQIAPWHQQLAAPRRTLGDLLGHLAVGGILVPCLWALQPRLIEVDDGLKQFMPVVLNTLLSASM